MSKYLSEKVLYQGRWLSLVEVAYETPKSERLVWECIRRKEATLAMVVVARLKPSDRFILIKQYRPAVDNYILGFPAGLSNGDPQDGLRELKEESGYTGTILDVSPVLSSHAWLTNDLGRVIFAEVDETRPENQNPHQELEPGEDIRVHLVKAEHIREFIQQEAKAGTQISPGLWYLFGLGPLVH